MKRVSVYVERWADNPEDGGSIPSPGPKQEGDSELARGQYGLAHCYLIWRKRVSDNTKYIKALFSNFDSSVYDLEEKSLLMIEELEQEIQSKQAKIDSLMIEHCPDEMTKEQMDNWGKHQVKTEA